MKKKNIEKGLPSRVVWEELEAWTRSKVQEFIQAVLEEEVREFLGRAKHERRQLVDGEPGYRNGYGKPRALTLSCGTIQVQRPRVRGVEQRFESRALPFFCRRTKEVNALIPELYLHGLAEGDFELALRGLLGDKAPVSASTVARLKVKWQVEFEQWHTRSLRGVDVVYMWVDGVYVKAGLEKEKAAMLVAVGALRDGRKVVLALEPGYRESTASWADVLRSLKERGMVSPKVVVGDGHLGIWGALAQVFPEAREQRCWNHKMLNVLDKLPKKLHDQAKEMLRAVVYADTREEANRLRKRFEQWCRKRGHAKAVNVLAADWERMTTFFSFPKPHWKHLRTTNPVESPFSGMRLRTDAARRFKRVDNATALIWKLLLIAETRFRRLQSPELLEEVFQGATFVNGEQRQLHLEDIAA